ncbi:MAG: DUF1836 domain-containing protein [Lachnospiraceae bacterium]|nr:DUF1836 domain-containing protein [Lachnospiraceae bacterium]
MDSEECLQNILDTLDHIEHIKVADIPTIELYMDQVTSFMDKGLHPKIRKSEDNRIMTKTMINNYAKNDLLPPPIKKKYSKEHILLLIFIYYFKGVLPIYEIQALLRPITERYFQTNAKLGLEDIYEEVFRLEESQIALLKADVKEKFTQAKGAFANATPDESDFLRKFTLICMLSFDVYLKKRMIDKLVEELNFESK